MYTYEIVATSMTPGIKDESDQIAEVSRYCKEELGWDRRKINYHFNINNDFLSDVITAYNMVEKKIDEPKSKAVSWYPRGTANDNHEIIERYDYVNHVGTKLTFVIAYAPERAYEANNKYYYICILDKYGIPVPRNCFASSDRLPYIKKRWKKLILDFYKKRD